MTARSRRARNRVEGCLLFLQFETPLALMEFPCFTRRDLMPNLLLLPLMEEGFFGDRLKAELDGDMLFLGLVKLLLRLSN